MYEDYKEWPHAARPNSRAPGLSTYPRARVLGYLPRGGPRRPIGLWTSARVNARGDRRRMRAPIPADLMPWSAVAGEKPTRPQRFFHVRAGAAVPGAHPAPPDGRPLQGGGLTVCARPVEPRSIRF